MLTVETALHQVADVDGARKKHLKCGGCVAEWQVTDEPQVPVDPRPLLRRVPLGHALDLVGRLVDVARDEGQIKCRILKLCNVIDNLKKPILTFIHSLCYVIHFVILETNREMKNY